MVMPEYDYEALDALGKSVICDIFGCLFNCVEIPVGFFSILKSYDNPKAIIAVALLTIGMSGFGIYRRLVHGKWPGAVDCTNPTSDSSNPALSPPS